MKLAAIIGVFVIAVALLLFQAKQTTISTMRMPSELAALPAGERMERVRVAGRVSALPINYETVREDGAASILKLSFTIQDPPANKGTNTTTESQPPTLSGTVPQISEPPPGGTVPVVFNGVRPDMFAPGRDVIIDGNFANGTLEATKLLTQCPSKYEPPDPVKQQQPKEHPAVP